MKALPLCIVLTPSLLLRVIYRRNISASCNKILFLEFDGCIFMYQPVVHSSALPSAHTKCDDLQQLPLGRRRFQIINFTLSSARSVYSSMSADYNWAYIYILLNLSHQHVTAHPRKGHCQTAICGMVELQVKQRQLAGHAQTASEIVCSVSLDSRRKTQCIAL
jgi:hypothetical protein